MGETGTVSVLGKSVRSAGRMYLGCQCFGQNGTVKWVGTVEGSGEKLRLEMVNEQWFGDEAERVLAEECRDWCQAVRGPLSDTQLAQALKVRRPTLSEVITDGEWSSARNSVRRMWCAQRVWRLQMSVEDVQAEYAEYVAKKEAEAEAALGAEEKAEVPGADAPYAIATDGSLQPASGVSGEAIGTDSTPLAGKPRDVELGDKPDASQPDAELPDDATPSIVPTDAPDASALTPVAPAVSPTEEQAAGAMIGDVPLEEVDAFVNAPAGDGNVPAWAA